MIVIDTVTINGTLGFPVISGFVVGFGLDGVIGEVGWELVGVSVCPQVEVGDGIDSAIAAVSITTLCGLDQGEITQRFLTNQTTPSI
jgi:hypothetical protein